MNDNISPADRLRQNEAERLSRIAKKYAEKNAKIVNKVEWLVINLGVKEPILTKGEKEIYKQLKEILKGEGDK